MLTIPVRQRCYEKGTTFIRMPCPLHPHVLEVMTASTNLIKLLCQWQEQFLSQCLGQEITVASMDVFQSGFWTTYMLFAKSKDLYLSSPTWKYSCKLQYYKIQRKCSCMSFHHSQTVCNSFIFYKSSSQNQSHWKQASNYSKHISIWMLNCTHVIPKALENRGTVKAMVNEI